MYGLLSCFYVFLLTFLQGFTSDEGEKVLRFDDKYWAGEVKKPIYNWLDVPSRINDRLLDVVNACLRGEGMAEIDNDILYWRIVQVVRSECTSKFKVNPAIMANISK